MTNKCPIPTSSGFSLVEVVLALGVIAFAILAILGVLPVGLATSHSGQNETRSAQLAQDIFSSLASQAPTKFPHLVINQPASGTAPNFSYNIDLDTAHQYDTLAADNEGRLIALASATDSIKYPYQILVQVAPNPTGFDAGLATEVMVRVISPPLPNPSATPSSNQTVRDYARVISKY